MTDYNKLKATELKDLLKERGIPSTGLTRKQQYIEALEAEDANAGKSGADGDDEGEVQAAAAAEEVVEEVVPAATADDDSEAAQPNGAHEAVPGPSKNEPPPPAAAAEAEAAEVEAAEQVQANVGMPAPSQPAEDVPPTREPSPESRKRKRRSPSPPVSQDSVNKRLKAADDENAAEVKLPEDETMVDAAKPEHDEAVNDGEEDKDMQDAGEQQPLAAENAEEVDSVGSLHRPTRAIYIRELVRPVQPQQLKSHLESVAAAPGSDREGLDTFHLDSLRTHAFAVFKSVSAAVRARSALHDVVWPDEPVRRPLWVDFVPDDQVFNWIETESANGGRRDGKRWEVVYDGPDDQATATHQEATQQPNRPEMKRNPSSAQNSNIPLSSPGTRDDRRSSQQQSQRPQVPPSPAPPKKQQEAPRSESFNQLDTRFKFTETKPKLYYLPRDQGLVDRRLQELDSKTSRSWNGGRDLDGPDAQLRRYTFDDGDVLVDGGADFGSFGVPPRRGGRGGGRGPRGRR